MQGAGRRTVLGVDVLQLSEARPELTYEGAVVAVVEVAEDGLDGLGGFLGVVEGDAGEQVVDNVELDDAVEQVLADPAKLAVDGGKGALNKGPVLSIVVRHLDVSVVEVSDGNCVPRLVLVF